MNSNENDRRSWYRRWVLGESHLDLIIPPVFHSEQLDGNEYRNELVRWLREVEQRAQSFVHSRTFAEEVLPLTQQAREHLDRKEEVEAAEFIHQAQARVNRAIISRESRGYRTRLFIAGLLWFAAFYGLQLLLFWIMDAGSEVWTVIAELLPFAWIGMLGGVLVSWWGFVVHTRNLEYDPSYNTWYLLKPPIGAVMGVFSVVVIKAGLITLQGSTEVNSAELLYIVAFLAGFSERFFVQMFDKVMTALLGGENTGSGMSSQPLVPKKKRAPLSSKG